MNKYQQKERTQPEMEVESMKSDWEDEEEGDLAEEENQGSRQPEEPALESVENPPAMLQGIKQSYGLIHHPWLNPDQQLKGNLHEQANADRNDRPDVSPNWRVGEKLVWLEG
ncbi:hypothetical protein AVEN_222222-1 [Araneus ventricosus]|uniref:Uncharacterized protein n=1 Tax=Araneus ventricosus TaxID=182803 RepID=A0A4Y2JBF6_ARAVE|nr:hypothetical protein AVEN_222222-1 [Araneus ventricosus]